MTDQWLEYSMKGKYNRCSPNQLDVPCGVPNNWLRGTETCDQGDFNMLKFINSHDHITIFATVITAVSTTISYQILS